MKHLLLAFVTICSLVLTSSAQIAPALEARLQYVLDSLCARYNIPGASAAVLIPNAGTWKGAYGLSHPGQPISTNMLFGIGSNTKTYMSAILLRMQEDALLDLDDTIGTWIQPQPYINGQITIRQLLNHSSGIYNYTNNPDLNMALAANLDSVWQPEQLLPFVKAPVFTPGTSWQYSNTNYLLAGLVIKAVSGQSLDSALRSYILQPHQLDHTILYPQEAPTGPVPNVWSMAYSQAYLEDIIGLYGYSDKATFSIANAAGAIMATADDNVRFWNKLMSGQIIAAASLSEMQQCIQLSSIRKYGLGIFRLSNINGRVAWSHGGTNLGFINENMVDSMNGTCISVLTNQDSVSNAILLNQVVAALHRETLRPLSAPHIAGTAANITVYPNPAHAYLNVTAGNSEPYTIHLSDMTGRELMTAELHGQLRLDVDGYAPGLYSVWLTDASNRRVSGQTIVLQ